MVVGAEPRLTYRSPSPDPPESLIVSVVRPAGTAMLYSLVAPLASEMPVIGTPLVSGVAVGGGVVPLQLTPTVAKAAVTSAIA